MEDNNFFDSSSLRLSKIRVKYVNYQNKPSEKKISIYTDDTCKEVLLKLASLNSNVVSDDIFAWFKLNGKIYPFGFSYETIELDYPYKNKNILDNRFIDTDGNRILIIIDKQPLHLLIENFSIDTLFYTTINDYLKYLNLDNKREITDKICLEKTKYNCKDLYNGKIVKYWPLLNPDKIFKKQTDIEKLKNETMAVSIMNKQSELVYSEKKYITPKEFETQLFSVSNNDESNIVYLVKLFSDIKLGIFKDILIPFSKITLDDYTNRYCKVLKDNITITNTHDKKYITQKNLLKWFKSQITSFSGSSLTSMDEINSVIFKLFKNNQYMSIIIYSNGLTKYLFNDVHSEVLTREYIHEMISLGNNFINNLNKKNIFSEKPLQLIKNSLEEQFNYMTCELIYPIKNYKQDILIKLIKNMTSFIRFNKQSDTKIIASFKKINNYGQSIYSVLTSLYKSKRNLTREQIINELKRIFLISDDEANEEYDNWDSDDNSPFKSGKDGIDIIFDIIGTNIKVDVLSVDNYQTMERIYKFINFLLTYYKTYLDTKKDPENLIKITTNIAIIDKLTEDELKTEQDIAQQIKIEEEILEDSILSDQETKEEEINRELIQQTKDESDKSIESDKSVKKDESVKPVKKDEPVKPVKKEESVKPVKKEESVSESDDDFSMGPLDESSGSSGGALQKIYRGGYNVNRYYLGRLQKYDNELFKNFKDLPRKNQYAVKCGATIGRQPIPVMKKDLERYNQSDEGIGVSFAEAINIKGRNPDIYYICPKYWDIKDEKPRDPTRIDEFRDHIVDNKMTTSQKKNTDNYILVRDEGGYWEEAGNDIERYKIDIIKGSHPEGYDLPCCKAPRKGANKFSKGWDVDVLINMNGRFQWKKGTVVSSTKKTVVVRQGGTIKTYDIADVRRHKSSKTLTNNFPLDIDTYGHIDPIIKQLVHQNINYPEVPNNNIGLVRKGIFRNSNIGDHSLLESLTEQFSTNNSSSTELRKNIIDDLNNLYKQNKSIILSIGEGSFINKFKMTDINLTKTEKLRFLKIVKSNYPFVERNIKRIQINKKKKGIQTLSPNELFKIFLKGGSTKERLIIYNELNIYTSIINFKRYINDLNEIILDEYIIPVITTISKYPSNTIGKPINISIVVFEKINEDIIIAPLKYKYDISDNLILLYKERRNMYEPIFYRKYSDHESIINIKDKHNFYYDQNNAFMSILETIHTKLNEYNNTLTIKDNLLSLDELKLVLIEHELPIINYVYDIYCKVVYIETINNVLIPISPTGIKDTMNLIFFPIIEKKNYPTYDNVINILKQIDTKIPNHKYLTDYSISVINTSTTNVNLVIKEIIFENNYYIPIKDELYDYKKHKINIITNESYTLIDKYIGLFDNFIDKRSDYLKKNEYMKKIQNLFFQKVYLLIKHNSKLLNQLHHIKYHDIILRVHKSSMIYSILDPLIKKDIVIINKKDILFYDIIEQDNKILIHSIDDKDANIIYYKLLKLFIECFINYSQKDYIRFLQLDISLVNLKSLLSENELLFSYIDIINDNYLEYFIRHSKYIRNYAIYGHSIPVAKLRQINKLKEKVKQSIKGEFTKQYPQIIHKLFGRKLNLMTYKNDLYSEKQVIYLVLNELFSDEEISFDLINSMIENDKLMKDDLQNLSDYFKISICLIAKDITKKFQHDIIVTHYRKMSDEIMIVFYQTDNTLIHIKKKDSEFILDNLSKNYIN